MTDFAVHRRLLGLIRGHLPRFAAPFGLGLVNSALLLGQAVAMAHVFAALFAPTPPRLVEPLVALVVLVTVRPLVGVAREHLTIGALTALKSDLRTRVMSHLARRGPIPLTRERSGELQSVVVDGVEHLDPYVSRYLPQLGIVGVTSITVLTTLATIDVPIALAVGGCAVAVPLLPRLWDRVLHRRGDDHWAAYAALHADFVDSLQGMTALKAIGAVERRQRELSTASDRLLQATMSQLRISLLESGLSAFALVLGPLVALAVALGRVEAGAIAPAEVFLVSLLTMELFRPFRELAAHWHAGYMGVFAARRLLATLDTAPLPEPRAPRALPAPANGGLPLAFEAVRYRYPDASHDALAQLTAHVPAGGEIAVVGRSGSGKSTLPALLLRFALPDEGVVRIGGVATTETDQRSCADAVALVPQSPTILHGTLADNLRVAAPRADDARLLEVVQAVGLDELAGGDAHAALARDLGERGALLSGGQRQRVALARALLRDAPVLVLDEATSALDVRSERSMLDLVRSRLHDRTRVVIAHRLASVRDADRILVVDAGRVVESGSHDELLELGGVYAVMLREQEGEAGTVRGGPLERVELGGIGR